jgi:predicted nucleic acid-binding protein
VGREFRGEQELIMIMVDSGVWIDLFKKRINKETDILKDILRKNENIGINYLVIAEILQGEQNKREYQRIKGILETFDLLEIDYNTILTATDIFRACQKGIKQNNITGQTMKTIDCIIASNCIENNLKLLHNDKHFDFIEKITGQLKVYKC